MLWLKLLKVRGWLCWLLLGAWLEEYVGLCTVLSAALCPLCDMPPLNVWLWLWLVSEGASWAILGPGSSVRRWPGDRSRTGAVAAGSYSVVFWRLRRHHMNANAARMMSRPPTPAPTPTPALPPVESPVEAT